MRNHHLPASCRLTRQLIGALIVMILRPGVWPARGQTSVTGQAPRAGLHTAQILELAKYLASTGGAPDSYARVVKAAFDSPQGDAINMTAFEENRSFV